MLVALYLLVACSHLLNRTTWQSESLTKNFKEYSSGMLLSRTLPHPYGWDCSLLLPGNLRVTSHFL